LPAEKMSWDRIDSARTKNQSEAAGFVARNILLNMTLSFVTILSVPIGSRRQFCHKSTGTRELGGLTAFQKFANV